MNQKGNHILGDVAMSTPSETMEAVRARIHKLADMVQGHQGDIRELKVIIDVIKKDIDSVRDSTATKEQLENLHRENRLKFELIETKMDTIKGDILGVREGVRDIKGWVAKLVWLVFAAIIGAGLTIILAGPPRIGQQHNTNIQQQGDSK